MRVEKTLNVKPRKRTATKILKLALPLLVVLIIMMILLAPVFVSSDAGRRMILARINGAISGKADFADLSMGWFKGIRVADISFKDNAGRISVEVEQFSTRPAYASMLTGRLSLNRTVIDKPRVEVNLKDFELTPADRAGEQSSALGAATPMVLPVKKMDLVLNDGSLKVTDPKSGTVQLSRINSRVSLQQPPQQSEFDLSMAVARDEGISEIKAAGHVTAKPQTGWSLRSTSGDLTVEVNDLDLESLGPIFALAGVDIDAKGSVTGNVKSRIKDGRLESLSAGVKAENLNVTGARLKGDRLQTARLDVSAKLSQSMETINIEALRIEGDWASVAATGTVPTGFKSAGDFLKADSSASLNGDFKCDLAALASQMPGTLRLKEGTRITSGQLTGNVETITAAGKRQVRADAVVAGLEGTVEGKKAALSESIRAEAIVSSDKAGMVFDKLEVTAPFARVNCTGRIESLSYTAAADLAKLQSELGQFVDLGQYKMAGELLSKGQVSVKEDKITASGTSTVKNILLSSSHGQSVSEPAANVDFSVNVDKKNNSVAIDSINAGASFGRLSISNGVWPLHEGSTMPLHATASASNVDLEKLLPFGVMFGSLPKEMQLSGIANSTLSIVSDGDVYKVATESTMIDGLKLVHPDAEKPFEPNYVTLAFEAEFDSNTKAFRRLKSLLLDAPDISAKVQFAQTTEDETTTLAGDAELEYDWPAVGAVAAPFLPEGLTLEGKRKDVITFRSTYPAAEPNQLVPNLSAQARLGFERADYKGLNFGPTDVDVQVQSGVLKVSPFTTTVNQGQFSLAGQADFKGKPPLFRIPKPMQMVKDVKINDEITNKLLKYVNPLFADAVNVSGFANFNCEQLAIPLKSEAKNDAVVIGTISMNRVRLQGSNLMGQILTTSGGDPRGTDMTVHPTRFVLQNGLLRYDDMQVDVGDNPVNFGGVIGLDKTLDMTVTLPYTTKGRTTRVGSQSAGRRITLPIRGTLDAPELDLGRLIEDQLEGQLEEQLKKVLEDVFK